MTQHYIKYKNEKKHIDIVSPAYFVNTVTA